MHIALEMETYLIPELIHTTAIPVPSLSLSISIQISVEIHVRVLEKRRNDDLPSIHFRQHARRHFLAYVS